MSSISGIRLGLCFLRYGPQQGQHVVSFCRQHHSVTDPKSHSGKPPSCSMSTAAVQKKPKTYSVDLSEISEEIQQAEAFKSRRRFITNDNLVNNILESLGSCDHRTPPMLELNPGPGVLTRGLLDCGFKVAALEKEKQFIPGLKKLEADSDGQLKVFYCDPYKLDPFFPSSCPPPMYTKDLMKELGVGEVPWDAESPLNVFGILHHLQESVLLYRYLHAVFNRLNIFTYGRTELNLLMSEKLYKTISCGPTDTHYKACTVLCRTAFDHQLLLKFPVSTFMKRTKLKESGAKTKATAKNHVCLVRLTPQRNLFNEDFLPGNANLFMAFIRMCFTKRNKTLGEKLQSWNPGEEEWVLQRLNVPEDKIIGKMLPHELKQLFEVMLQSQRYSYSLLLDHLQKVLG